MGTGPGRREQSWSETVRNGQILDSSFLKSLFKIYFIFNVFFKNN